MKPFHTTLLMGLLATAACVIAAYFYPWPETQVSAGEIGNDLFEEFEKQVWSVNISEFDRTNENFKSLNLRRKGQRWVVGKSNIALTGDLITRAVSALNSKAILQEKSEDQQDHAKYGVVDPQRFQAVADRDALGVQISLEDVNRNKLGSLIVGDQVKNTRNQFYVRKPGQPKVYVIEFDAGVLTTQFGDWMNPNIFNVATRQNRNDALVQTLSVDNSRIDLSNSSGEKTFFYRANVQPDTPQSVKINSLEIPVGDDWGDANATPEHRAALSGIWLSLSNIPLIDVKPKNEKLAKALAKGTQLNTTLLAPAKAKGFRLGADGEIESTNGKLTVATSNGLETDMAIGQLATTNEAATTSLNYYVMLTTRLSEESQTKPQKPANEDGSELSEEQLKIHARAMEQWQERFKTATQKVTEINNVHSAWYYVISSDTVNRLRPDLPSLQVAEPEESEGETLEPAQPEPEGPAESPSDEETPSADAG